MKLRRRIRAGVSILPGRAGRAIPWFSRRPPGRSNQKSRSKYTPRFFKPTCSNIPIELIASNGAVHHVPIVLPGREEPVELTI
jgi:hypothetical protein